MSDARQPPKPSAPAKPAAPSHQPAVKTPHETSRVVGETLVGPPKSPPASGASAESPPSTVILAGGPYAGLLGPPEADEELGRLGGYAVLRELGRGGMGLVFEAEDLRLGRRVALKVMLPDFAKQPEAKQRFLREARSAAAVEHDNIVPVYQVGEEHGVPFLAMRLLPGESLSDLLARKGSLPAYSVAGLGRQAAQGLAAAHERGLIHRDIKPGNLWVESGGRVRVLDFGLARPQEAVGELTSSGAVVGTPEYLAPEQLRGEDLDGRADLFSLGAVLYRAATGTSPFRRETLYGTLKAVESETPPDPRTLKPELPGPLAELILKLLAKDRNQRPTNAAAAAKAFKDLGPMLAKGGESLAGPAPPPAPADISQTAVLATAVADRPEKPTGAAQAASLTPTAQPTAFPVFEPPPVLPSRIAPRKPSPQVKPKRKAVAGRQPPRTNRNVLLAAGGGFLGLLGVIFAITLSTGDATLRIEGLDPQMKVEVTNGGKVVRIIDQTTGAAAELDPGEYELTLKGGTGEGFTATLKEDSITLSRGDEKVVRIEKVPESKTPPAAPASGIVASGDHALRFDGRGSHVLLPTLTVPQGPLTVEAWIVRDRAGDERVAVAGGQAFGSLWLSGESAGFWYQTAGFGNTQVRQPSGPVPGRLTHVAGVWDGETIACYVDGKPVSFRGRRGELPAATRPAHRSHIGAEGDQTKVDDRGDTDETTGHFAGVIDEVRYSDVARYKGEFVPARRFEPDEHTLALYHLDEGSGAVAKDASGNGHEGKVVRATWVSGTDGVASGLALPAAGGGSPGYALRFDGTDDEVRTPVEVSGTGDFTVEGWVVAEMPKQWGPVFGSKWMKLRTVQDSSVGYRWTASIGTPLAEGKERHRGWAAEVPVAAGQRAHVAIVRKDKKVRAYVGGRGGGFDVGWGEPGGDDAPLSIPPAALLVGFDGRFHHFSGTIDEVRVSSVARYDNDFTPAERFEPDAETLALYHFDEGAGDVLKDASGNGRDAKIVDATWVPEPAGRADATSPLWIPQISPTTGLDPPAIVGPGTVALKENGLHIRRSDAGFSGYNGPTRARDSVVRADFDLRKGDSVGLSIRKRGVERYSLTAHPDGDLVILRFDNSGNQTLARHEAGSALPSPVNLALAAAGDRLIAFVDGRQVLEARDDAYAEGHCGVFAGGPSVDCLIRGFEVCDLDGTSRTPEQVLGADGGGFADLLVGRGLAGWTALKIPGGGPASPGDWMLRDGVLECATRNPGWLRYDRKLGDFALELEFLAPKGGNSGVLVRHSGEEPLPGHGMEIQIVDAEPGQFSGSGLTGAIFSAVGPSPADRMKRGEWNRMSIVCRGEQVAVTLNGMKVVDAVVDKVPALAGRPRSGYVGFYNHDGSAAGVKFRSVRLREFP